MQLCRSEWGGPSADNLLVLSFVFAQPEQVALEAAVLECSDRLPGPPPAEPVDDADLVAAGRALEAAKRDLAAASVREWHSARAVSSGEPLPAGGPAALLDQREAAVADVERLKGRVHDLGQLQQRCRERLAALRADASRAALKAYREELSRRLRVLDAKLTEGLLTQFLPEMLSLRVRLHQTSLGAY